MSDKLIDTLWEQSVGRYPSVKKMSKDKQEIVENTFFLGIRAAAITILIAKKRMDKVGQEKLGNDAMELTAKALENEIMERLNPTAEDNRHRRPQN
jgi:hypothetical protein